MNKKKYKCINLLISSCEINNCRHLLIIITKLPSNRIMYTRAYNLDWFLVCIIKTTLLQWVFPSTPLNLSFRRIAWWGERCSWCDWWTSHSFNYWDVEHFKSRLLLDGENKSLTGWQGRWGERNQEWTYKLLEAEFNYIILVPNINSKGSEF